MKYTEFVKIMSKERTNRYLWACSDISKNAMTLYRLNLKLSQELFTIISCFEVALRNSIDELLKRPLGNEWLKESILGGGIFDVKTCAITAKIIQDNCNKLKNYYSHSKLIAEMDFGFWRYLFAQPQFLASGKILLKIFPAKPKSSPSIQYNHSFVFNELGRINALRNRIAHHEPICFKQNSSIIDTSFAKQNYRLILDFFNWLQINEKDLLYGIDHVNDVILKIDKL
jgi:hypothetical protein